MPSDPSLAWSPVAVLEAAGLNRPFLRLGVYIVHPFEREKTERASSRVRASARKSGPDPAAIVAPRARVDMAMPSPANLTMASITTLQRAAGNSAVTGLLTIQCAPAGGSGDGPPALALPESPEALGARLGVASKGLPSRFDYIVAGINQASLSAADAVKAATSATREIGLRLFSETVGADVVLCSVQPGTGKPVLIVRPNGVVVRGTADIAVASPPSLERPMVVTNVRSNVGPGETTGPAKVTPGKGSEHA